MRFLFGAVARGLCENLIKEFEKMLLFYKNTYPHSAVEFEKAYKISTITYLKAWLGILYLIFYQVPKKQTFYFQGLRNKAILDLLPLTNISIIGGKPERRKTKEMGFGFLWTGGIVAAILIGSQRKRPAALAIQIQVFLRKFINSNSSFFLIEDTLPVGSFFAFAGNALSLPTILLQHGYLTGTEILIDGRNCSYNILYSKDQEKFIDNSKAVSFELGPPIDILTDNFLTNEIVLVGTGGKGYIPRLYFKALDVFGQIFNNLETSGFKVIYRPHPNEDPNDYDQLFRVIDNRSSSECLSGGKKIFIGYVSTMLFEAKTFGHFVIAIRDPEEPALAYIPDYELDANNLENMEILIPILFENMEFKRYEKLKPLKERFSNILYQINNINHQPTNNEIY